ncbi:polypeptide N-acetylgalactosaminyltransferase 16-like [Centruroides vittatus]|uniref:polypeptide N-acetylgalactosaminyltransferase 16-like n=1 Tax=Centruroides vittatus TaxID=120091 RepID=UPI00350FEB41
MRRRWHVRLLALSLGLVIGVSIYTFLTLASLRGRRKAAYVSVQPVVVFNDRAYIQGETTHQGDSYSRHAFNVDISNNLLPDRSLPDSRHALCQEKLYDWSGSIPQVSVIISFHNEARSALLRTVMSVLNRSPSDILIEIILIDDFSDNAQDGEQLTILPKVWLSRNDRREGLIRSRGKGASIARGDYLMFLDSHCEVNVGWMEPLLDRVTKNPKLLASPVIDIIDIETFHYKSSSPDLKGGFDWGLRFIWLPLTAEEKSKRQHPTEPIKSPVIPGGLFLIQKNWFDTLGGFDEGLEIWGAENCEMSIKAWLCGGQIETVPCSRVGHVFRKRHPYTFPNGSAATYLANSVRVAEVWMDEYKDYFYSNRPVARNVAVSNLEERKKLKNNLQCKNFKWYLENVYPELKVPNGDATAFGQLQQGDECLGISSPNSLHVFLTSCLYSRPSQDWTFSKEGQLKSNGKCLSVKKENLLNYSVVMESCNHNIQQKWTRRRRLLVHKPTGLCLETQNQQEVVIGECRRQSYTQQWDFSMELQTWD